jgi:hypothetical protein
VLRSCGAKRQHTAHQSARIYYRHHPFFDQEVQIVRTIRLTNPSVIVRFEDGLRIAIPRWMLDAAYCAALPEKSTARLSLQALVELRDLIDRQSWSAGQTTPR